VVDPRWIVPVPRDVVDLARKGADLVVTVEDGVLEGGFGWAVRDALSESGVPVQTLGIPRRYLEQGRRSALQAELGLDAVGIAASVGSRLARMGRVAPVPSAADLAE
jgi:1-deoxy-D-xylulose-5-phosphate synthase